MKAARIDKPGAIRDRGYQPYTGAYQQPGPGLIARRMLKLTLPQWWVILLLVAAAFRLLVGAAVLWIKVGIASALMQAGNAAAQGVPADKMPNPNESVLGILIDGSGTLFIAFMLALFVGCNAIVDDARSGAFQFYFARPVSKAQYLVGKLTPVLVIVGAAVIVPVLALALLRLALTPEGHVAPEAMRVGAAVACGVIETLVLSVPALALSSLSSRRGYAQGAFATLFVLPWVVGGILSRVTGSAWPLLLSIPAHLENVARFCFRMPDPDARRLPVWVSGLVLTAMVAGSIALLRRRLDDIEVVQGS